MPAARTLLLVVAAALMAATARADDFFISRLPPVDATESSAAAPSPSDRFVPYQIPQQTPAFGVPLTPPVEPSLLRTAGRELQSPGYDLPQTIAQPPALYVEPYGGPAIDPNMLPPPEGVIAPLAHPLDYKPDSFFQKLTVQGTWLPRNGTGASGENYGMTDFEIFGTFAAPFPTADTPLLITPGYGMHWLDGAQTPDMPPRLYDIYVDLVWITKPMEGWTNIVGATPGYWGDLENYTSDGFRVKGKQILIYDWIPGRVQVVGGVLFLSRRDIYLLPVGGIIWTPNDDWRIEATFPRPKIARRLTWDGVTENWFYLAGEFGGDSWAVERTSGADDNLILRDLRAILGWERKMDGGAHQRVEIAYVFNRSVEYTSGLPPEFYPESTVMLRAGVTY